MSGPRSPAPILVLTATLGASPWLAETVRGVQMHAGPSCIHVLAAPADQVDALQRRFPHCRVVRDFGREGGLYGALNAALQAAEDQRWQWMTFIADDDGLLPGFATVLAAARRFDGNRELRITQGQVEMVNEVGRRMCRIPYARRGRDVPALVAAGYSPFNQQGMIYTRAAVAKAGRFRPEMKVCADAAHWLTAIEKGAQVEHLHVPAAYFRIRPGQLSGQIATHQAEFESLRAQARRIHGPGSTWPAVARFRLQNAFLYLERIRRIGPVTGYRMLEAKA